MLNEITLPNPEVKPPISRLGATYDHPSVFSLSIDRPDINVGPTVKARFRNYRNLVDDNGDTIFLGDGITQKSEYGPSIRNRSISDLYAWIQSRPNAANIVSALNTLLGEIITWDLEQQVIESQGS